MTPSSGYIVVVEDRVSNPVAEQVLTAEGVVIGRATTCDIVLDHNNVSRRHARVFAAQGGVWIEDLQSANGVFVDGDAIAAPRRVDQRSAIQIADFQIFLRPRSSHGRGVAPQKGSPYLPWVIAGVCTALLALVVVAYLLFVPRPMIPPEMPVSAPAPQATVLAEESSQALLPILQEAEAMLGQRRLAAASSALDRAQVLAPRDARVTRIAERLSAERDHEQTFLQAEAAMREGRDSLAARLVLRVPKESAFRTDAATLGRTLLPRIEVLERNACKTAVTVECEQIHLLVIHLTELITGGTG